MYSRIFDKIMPKKKYKALVILPDGGRITIGEFDSYDECREFINGVTLATR